MFIKATQISEAFNKILRPFKARIWEFRRIFTSAVLTLLLVIPVSADTAPTTILVATNANNSANWSYFQSFGLAFTNAVSADISSATVAVLQANGRVSTLAAEPYSFVPAGLSNVASISITVEIILALTSNGTVTAWGGYGETNVPKSVSNVVAIAAGQSQELALQSNGTISSWGQGTSPPTGLSNVVAIAPNLALQANGNLVGWGAFPPPAGLSNIIAISQGSQLALNADGIVVGWTPSAITNSLTGITNTVAIASSLNGYLALQANGTVVSGGTTPPKFFGTLSNVFSIGPGAETVITGDGSPAFTVQPGNQTTASGGTIWLHARAVGVQPLTYQWQLNGTNLPGATDDDLIITNATEANSGPYQALATNNVNWAASSTATVTVQPPALVSIELTDPQLESNGNLIITAKTTNGAPYSLSNPALFSLETSTNLLNWNPLTNELILTNGTITVSNPQAPATATFYRLLRQ
jgi:hypothetical protein